MPRPAPKPASPRPLPSDLLDGGHASCRGFFFPPAPRDRAWSVAGAGWEALPAGHYATRRDFPYWEIGYIAGGAGQLELGGRREALAAGSLHVIAPDTRRGRRSDARRPLRRHFLWLAGPRVPALLAAAGLAPDTTRVAQAPGELRDLFDWLLREGESGADDRTAVELLVRLLLHKAGRAARRADAPLIAASSAAASARENYERCLAAIAASAGRLRTTAELAASAGLRAETVCRLFQRFSDRPPGDHLRAARVRAARELLARPGARAKEVAAELGFADAFHFSRVFKSETGLSPRAWLGRVS